MPRRKKLPPRGEFVSLGDCYEAAGKYILDASKLYMGSGGRVEGDTADASNLTLVHAEVAGQGAMEGETFGHAFVVEGRGMDATVIDRSNNRDIRLPRILYYAIGQIEDIGNYHEYTPEEMMIRLLKYKHWGPWELQTRSGK